MSTKSTLPLGVFVGGPNGSDAGANASIISQLNDFVSTVGVSPAFMDGYIDQSQSIDQWAGNASWTAWSWAQTPIANQTTPVIGLPMATNGNAGNPDPVFQAFASGQYDTVLKGMVDAWAAQGFTTQYWRPGYEMNVSSMPWYVGDNTQTQADFVSAFQHISSVLHSAGQSDGVDVKVVWSPNVQNWNGNINVANLYPGNGAVDVIGPDEYDNMYPRDLYDWDKNNGTVDSSFAQWSSDPVNIEHYFTYPDANQYHPTGDGQGNSMSLPQLIAMAQANGKPIALSETGAGGGGGTSVSDDPTFVKWLATTLQNAGVPVAYVNTWDANDNGNWSFSLPGSNKPQEAAAWQQYFGSGASAATNNNPTPVATSSNTPDPAPTSVVTTPVLTTLGSGSDTITVSLSEDAWNGDAQATLKVDGQQIGGTQTVTALQNAGATQSFALQGNFGSGSHVVTVDFLNDAYGGTTTTDRNIYVDSVSNNGVTSQENAPMLSAGNQDFNIGVSSGLTNPTAAFITQATMTAPGGDATLTASNTSETFNFTAGNFGNDVIQGFSTGNDVIALSAQQTNGFAAVQNELSSSQGGTVLTLDSSHSILLPGVTPSSLSASNFSFS